MFDFGILDVGKCYSKEGYHAWWIKFEGGCVIQSEEGERLA